MELTKACSKVLDQLADLVKQIQDEDFIRSTETLSNSTIGQHLRHALEFFQCFHQGFEKGTLNYDKRTHNSIIEQDKDLAQSVINQIRQFLTILTDKPLRLELGYDLFNNHFIMVDTTANRELVYNIEHTVHHMAIMKIGIRELADYVQLPPDLGVAASSIRYQGAPSQIAY